MEVTEETAIFLDREVGLLGGQKMAAAPEECRCRTRNSTSVLQRASRRPKGSFSLLTQTSTWSLRKLFHPGARVNGDRPPGAENI